MGLSIVIPAYNEARCLAQTLEAILNSCQQLQSELQVPSEVVVVDNGSDDQTMTIARELGARVLSYEARNIAAVRNRGVREARHEIVVTVDADTFVPRDAFSKIWHAMESGQHYGGGVRTGVKTEGRLLRFSYAAVNSMILSREGVSLGMFFCRRDIFEAIGGFPEEFLVGEDLAFARKLRDFSKSHGKSYCNLQTLQILTLARKSASLSETLKAYYNSTKIAFGYPVTRDSLGYWYNPRR